MLAPVTHIRPLTFIQRERLLPTPGDVLALVGQDIKTSTVVGLTNETPKHITMDVARGLGVPVSEVDQYIKRDKGNQVAEGDVIASRKGLWKRTVRSQVDGRIVHIERGRVLIQVDEKPYELKAGFPGTVSGIILDQGIVLETTGGLVQGVWGNGKVGNGMLIALADTPDFEITPDQVNVKMRGSVLLAGHCGQEAVLVHGVEQQLRGLILSSIATTLIPMAKRMPFAIIVTDGFGKHPMNEAAFTYLESIHQENVAINATPFNRQDATRPEIIVPVNVSENLMGVQPPRDLDMLAPGKKVLITRAPHQGQIGKIDFILPGLTRFPNGVQTEAATIQLGDPSKAENIIVPLANLEILA